MDLENTININSNIPEYLSLFIHYQLEKIDESQINEILFDKIKVLLTYLREKDIFEQWYQSHLARRFIFDKPISEDIEDKMILQLKSYCSSQFISKLERMFKDIAISKTIMNEFNCSMNLNVRVLTTGVWPMQSLTFQCILPSSVNEAYQSFRSFYLTKYNGRSLTLQSNCGTADLSALFYDQSNKTMKYTLNVSTHQMVILMIFNTNKSSYSLEVSFRFKLFDLITLFIEGDSTADKYQ